MSPQSPSNSSISTDTDQAGKNPAAAFGANEWLVDEIYQQYLQDPNSVDRAWWDFFADYKPGAPQASAPVNNAATGTAGTTTAAPATPARPAATPAPAAPQPAAAPPAAQPAAKAPVPAPAKAAPAPAKPAAAKSQAPKAQPADGVKPGIEQVTLRGPSAAVAKNMDASLEVPTATSVRALPVKLLFDNRIVINNHLKRARGGKISFTHLIGYAMVQAIKAMPSMNWHYAKVDGKPTLVKPEHIKFGLAIDLVKPNGDRQLVVAGIEKAETLNFFEFWQAYEDIVRRARDNKLTMADFTGVTVSLTNPGGLGTVHSVPRLMPNQSVILGVGSMDYPAEFQGTSQDTLNKLGISKVMTLTSTYDHRVIQGAASGEFLRAVANLLLGENGFYDDIFEALRIPYEPVRWLKDIDASHDDDVTKRRAADTPTGRATSRHRPAASASTSPGLTAHGNNLGTWARCRPRPCEPDCPRSCRWQVHNPHHKPLVVFTPKSMLRLKAAASKAEEFTTGQFRPVIGDDSVDPAAVKKVVFCTGKVYYDLEAERKKRGVTDTAILRIERLYPLPGTELQAEIKKYPNAEKYLWAQEEPANQGAWPFIALNLIDHLDLAVGADVPHGERLRRISRPHGSSPAVGSAKRHQAEQEQLVREVFEA
ncbi:2-oxoglutarate dehydrogenase E1 component [Streptomyces hirsutus]